MVGGFGGGDSWPNWWEVSWGLWEVTEDERGPSSDGSLFLVVEVTWREGSASIPVDVERLRVWPPREWERFLRFCT